jgi:hypothetical protein
MLLFFIEGSYLYIERAFRIINLPLFCFVSFKIEKSNKNLTALDYFQKAINVDYYLNGSVRSIDETQKLQSFNATLSLCDTYPLLLHEQVSPIVDLMALNNSHFKKLKEFITLQLPSGFPVKIGKFQTRAYVYLKYIDWTHANKPDRIRIFRDDGKFHFTKSL